MSGAFHDLVGELVALNVGIRLGDCGELLVDAPPQTLDASLRERISAHKPELLRMLQTQAVFTDLGHIAPILTRDGDAPASFAQEGLWLHEQLAARDSYNVPFALRVRGSLDVSVLQRALTAVGMRHEALRTTFRFDGTRLRQRVGPAFDAGLVAQDLTGISAAEQERVLETALAGLANEPFDMENGPLHRCRLYKLAQTEHVFSLVVHHIIFDHWSRGPLARDLVGFYAALSGEANEALPELPVQYRDYAVWQGRHFEGPHGQQQFAYWAEELREAPPLLNLPTDRPRQPLSLARGGTVLFTLGTERAGALAALAQQQGTTLFMLLQAAFAILMHRLSGQEDVCVGTPVAGRSRRELEDLIGLFVNTLILRSKVDRDEPFTRLLARVRHTVLQAFTHQDIAFQRLVQELKPVRSPDFSPLFQVMFTLQNTPLERLQAAGLAFELLGTPPQSAKFDLVWTLAEAQGQLFGRIEYNTDLFDEATIKRMARHYEVLLEGICGRPQAKVGELPLLTPEEERQLLVEWNDTAAQYPQEQAIHQLFEQQVRRAPDAVAVVYDGEQLTYGQLNARANQLARQLRSQGVGAEVLVGICVERSLEMVVGLLGILKAGGAYVPLDPSYPNERLAYMLADAAPKVLLTQERLLAQLPASQAKVLCLDRDWPQVKGQEQDDLDNLTRPENLAYVIYTSGSTGQPKGVGNVHRAIVNRLKWMQDAYGLQPQDTVVQKTPFSFDVSVWEFFWTLLYGARLVVAKPEGHKDADYLLQLMRQERVSTAHFVPSMLDVFLRALGARRPPQSLRTVVCSGEALPLELQERFFAQMGPQVRLHNLYGPTEAAVDVSYWECRSDAGLRTVPIGRPIANTQLYILDAELRPVPVGVAGELHIGGAGLARGYLNKPELTAQKFIANPFGEAGSRLYKTGDLARYLADGNIEYLGRMDNQVKLRGFRIELGEIESVLQQQDAVAQAVVLVREDEPGDKRLVAYVVGKGEAPLEPTELRGHLKAKLPEYMVPATFVQLAQVPLSPNGKVDRKALPAPDGQRQASKEYVEPRTDTEKKLAAIWAEVLKVEKVGIHDNFFELGGHSLLAVSLMERMRREGFAADIRDVFVASTLGVLAGQLEAAGPAQAVQIPPNQLHGDVDVITPAMLPLVQLTQAEIDAIVARVPGGVRNVQDIYPLAPLQEGILFHHLVAVRGDPYVLRTVMAFERRERLNDVLQALQAAIDRHDILRTAVLWEGLREPVQVVHRHAELPVEELDLDAALGDGEAQLRARFDPDEYRIDVRTAPMLNAAVARNGDHWLLLLLCHHMVEDNTSLRLLHAETRQQLAGRGDRLPPPVPFRNFVARARLGTPQEEHEAFFRRLLAGVDETTAPFRLWEVRGAKGCPLEEHKRELDAPLAARLRNAARSLGVSAASFFHLAWALVLARASGRDDVVFGTVLFGRMLGEQGADRCLGLFINTLPMRVQVDGRGAQVALREVHDQLASLLRHEHAPLVLAQRASGLPPATPLFTCLLNYRHRPKTVTDDALPVPLGMRMLHSEERTNYPLKVAVDDDGQAFQLAVQVVRDVAASGVCDLMEAALAALVESLERSPGAALIGLDILPRSQVARQLSAWNATEAPYPRDKAIHQLFEEQAHRDPHAVAVVYEGEQLTYGELDARANQLARHLRSQGVRPEVLVGICMERSLEMVLGLLGVLKAGGAYVPLDPGYPQERLAYMLQDAAPKVLLTQERLLAQLPASEAQVVCLDRDWPQVAGCARGGLENLTGFDNLAYVTYTSGSTGQPKGVLTRQQGAVNYLHFIRTAYEVSPADRVLQIPTLAFDASARDILGTLLSGAGLHLLASPEAKSAPDIRARLHGSACTAILSITPSLLEQVVAAGDEPLPSLRIVLVSGEVLAPAVCEAVAQRLGSQVQVVNQYGPTECTMTSSYFRVQAGAAICVGRPIANARMYILDGQLRPVPIGATGELHIGGAGVTRGYLNKPELTTQKFIADPFGELGSRLYKTGDLARYRRDGNIEYLGRTDNQVKLRGFRIELGEVESVLQQQDAVAQAVVLVREDEPGDKRLVAYVVGKEQEQQLDVEPLRSALKARLPEYMVPAVYVQLPALPLTPNGKVDRKALPAPEGKRQAGNEYVEPRTETEKKLAAIWADVLKVEKVGIHDNFFELGGHSLLAMRVVAHASSVLGRAVPVRVLFEHGELEALARWVDDVPPDGQRDLPIPATPRDGELLLSHAQQRLWFLDQCERGQANYNIPLALKLHGGGVDAPLLTRAFAVLGERHETLRTVFRVENDEPRQVIEPALQLQVTVHDLSSEPRSHERAKELIQEEARRPFDLETGPLIRVNLLRIAAREHVLLLTVHHIATDGWSMSVLASELAQILGALRGGREPQLPPLPVQYADYAAWQRRTFAGDSLDRELAYWKRQLQGAPALLALPTDRLRPATQTHRGATVEFALDSRLGGRLKQLAQAEGATLFMVLQAAFSVLLHRYSGQDDISVGVPVAGRNRKELEGLIGLFVNTLVLRTRIDAKETFRQLLVRARETALQAYAHQEVPFDKVVEEVKPARSLSYSPLFQVMFALQNAPRERLEVPGLRFQAMNEHSRTAKFDLTCTLTEHPGEIAGSLEYNTDLFDEGTIRRLAGHYVVLLEGICAKPTTRLQDLPLLTKEEQSQLLVEWNDTATPYPRDQAIHQLFEQQVRRAPDAVAVLYEGEQLTYGELNARANQLARHLRGQGVGPEVLVGICVERSIEMVVGLLGILKAGGAYVPLDAGYPGERLAYMLQDAAPKVLLTQERLLAQLPACEAKVLCLDRDAHKLAAYAQEDLENLTGPDHLAYVIYTSGSTGRPKGVLISNASVVQLATSKSYIDVRPSDTWLQLSPLSFDAATLELWACLLHGARLAVHPAGAVDFRELAKVIDRYGVTMLWLTSALFNEVAAHDVTAFGGLRVLLAGGDVLPVAAVRSVLRAYPGICLINGYGPTETTTFAATYTFAPAFDRHAAPIGRPISNAQIYLLDAQLRPVPVGVVGELHIGGTGLARGYLNNPELTANKFIAHPFGEPGSRLYKTGDLARYLADGNIEYLGRIDNQVKLRGFRIELGEIESALRQHEAVADALVLVREDETGDKRLVAYLATGQQPAPVEQLRLLLKGRLPEYMLPAAYVQLPQLPLTPNGKVDRKALPTPEGERQASTEYVEPKTVTQQTLAAIWAEVMNLEKVGLHDDFFELGGHSLLASRLMSRIRAAWDLELPLRELFESPTVALLANRIEQEDSAQESVEL